MRGSIHHTPILLLCLLAFVCGGCKPKATNEALAKVNVGMDIPAATKLLGKPEVQEDIPFGGRKTERLVYGVEPNQVELVFIDGRLISKSGEFVPKGKL